MNEFKMAALFCVLCACAVDPIPVDPIGTWDNTYSWTAGNCGATTPGMFPFSVLKAGDTTFVIKDPDPSVTSVSGIVACTESLCQLTLHETFSTTSAGATTTGTVDANLTLDEFDNISGAGTFGMRMPSGASCTQQFTATGTHR